MIRVFRLTYAEHLQNDKEGGDKVDSWRTVSRDVAVEDGDAYDAIMKLRKLGPHDDTAKELVVGQRVLGVTLISEAQ